MSGPAEGAMARNAEAATQAPQRLPWYLAILHGLGGLLTGGLLIGFLFITLLDDLASPAVGVTGVLLIATATAIAWFRKHLFVRLFALSLSIAGHAAVASYLDESFGFDGLVLGMVLLAIVLYALYSDPLHRFLSVLGTLLLLAAWIVGGDGLNPNALHGLLLLVAAGNLWIFTTPASDRIRPAGYAAAITMLLLPLLSLEDTAIDWRGARIIAVLYAASILWLLQRAHAGFRGPWLAVAAVAALALGAVTTPGLAFAVGLLAIGFWRVERILTALGLLFLPVFLVVFYYNLEISLLEKSFMLLAGGALMLALRQALVIWERKAQRSEGAS